VDEIDAEKQTLARKIQLLKENLCEVQRRKTKLEISLHQALAEKESIVRRQAEEVAKGAQVEEELAKERQDGKEALELLKDRLTRSHEDLLQSSLDAHRAEVQQATEEQRTSELRKLRLQVETKEQHIKQISVLTSVSYLSLSKVATSCSRAETQHYVSLGFTMIHPLPSPMLVSGNLRRESEAVWRHTRVAGHELAILWVFAGV